MTRALVPAGLLLAGGCLLDTTPVACTAEARPGLSVTVLDEPTARPLLTGVTVTARDGAHAESVTTSFGGLYSLAYERPGRYDLTVTHADYRPWTRTGVVVLADDCHVITVGVTASLTPATPSPGH